MRIMKFLDSPSPSALWNVRQKGRALWNDKGERVGLCGITKAGRALWNDNVTSMEKQGMSPITKHDQFFSHNKTESRTVLRNLTCV
jgi:hypothetical protein